jgi:hypothetical protein
MQHCWPVWTMHAVLGNLGWWIRFDFKFFILIVLSQAIRGWLPQKNLGFLSLGKAFSVFTERNVYQCYEFLAFKNSRFCNSLYNFLQLHPPSFETTFAPCMQSLKLYILFLINFINVVFPTTDCYRGIYYSLAVRRFWEGGFRIYLNFRGGLRWGIR